MFFPKFLVCSVRQVKHLQLQKFIGIFLYTIVIMQHAWTIESLPRHTFHNCSIFFNFSLESLIWSDFLIPFNCTTEVWWPGVPGCPGQSQFWGLCPGFLQNHWFCGLVLVIPKATHFTLKSMFLGHVNVTYKV